jgi:hypothetical protein
MQGFCLCCAKRISDQGEVCPQASKYYSGEDTFLQLTGYYEVKYEATADECISCRFLYFFYFASFAA